jgi:serine/threonine protein kinase
MPYYQDSAIARLSGKLSDAVENTEARDFNERFITPQKVREILTTDENELIKLLEEISKSRLKKKKASECLKRLLPEEKPQRIILLGILVYDRHQTALDVFGQWLSNEASVPDFPSDEDLPLEREDAEKIFGIDAQFILDYQAIFLPVVLHKDDHVTLGEARRRPYSNRDLIGRGASGTVYKVEIPPEHWEYEEVLDHGATEVKTNTDTIVLAIKRFQKTENIAATSASKYFNDEKDFLIKLRRERARHENILLDLGSITEDVGEGGKIHDLFFPLALCNLREFLTGEKLGDHFLNELTPHDRAEIFENAVDIAGALSFMHHYNKSHYDIKPDNVLLFGESKKGAKLTWKIADFNFSRDEGARPQTSLWELSERLQSPQNALTYSTRVRGIFQAPEVREDLGSELGELSDVWSMGCLLLVVLSYLDGCENTVKEFEERLQLHAKNNTKPMSFYNTPDMQEWSQSQRKYHLRKGKYLAENELNSLYLSPDPESTKLVAVNPNVLSWMETLCSNADRRDFAQIGEAKFVRSVVKYLRTKVIVVDRKERDSSKKLHERMSYMLEEFKNSKAKQRTRAGSLFTTASEKDSSDVDELSLSITPRSNTTPSLKPGSSYYSSERPIGEGRNASITSIGANERPDHSDICSATDQGDITRLEEIRLSYACDSVNTLCPRCEEYPLHIAILNKDQKTLLTLLKFRDLESINFRRNTCSRTALELACRDSDNYTILKELLNHENVEFNQEIYDVLKTLNLGHRKRELLRIKLAERNVEQRNASSVSAERPRTGRLRNILRRRSTTNP